jgi:addiction module HigA family antidote
VASPYPKALKAQGIEFAIPEGPDCVGGEARAEGIMSIKRDDLDTGRVDFSEVATGKRLPLIHPAKSCATIFLQPMKISVYALAQAIKAPRSRVNDIVLGRRGITVDTAFRLARYFGTTPDFWINLQARHDLEATDRKLRRRIEREVRPRAA